MFIIFCCIALANKWCWVASEPQMEPCEEERWLEVITWQGGDWSRLIWCSRVSVLDADNSVLKEKWGELILPSQPQRTNFSGSVVCACACVRRGCRQKHHRQTDKQTDSQAHLGLHKSRMLWWKDGRFGSLHFSLSVTFLFYLILKYFLPEKRVETLREGFDSADGDRRFSFAPYFVNCRRDSCCLCEIKRRNISSWRSALWVTCTLWRGRSPVFFLFFKRRLQKV